jgi:hypothetical protein
MSTRPVLLRELAELLMQQGVFITDVVYVVRGKEL